MTCSNLKFSYKIGDGICDQVLNNNECCYDGNDCKAVDSECPQCPKDYLAIIRRHRGKCLPSFNTDLCCYSLGACPESKDIYNCDSSARISFLEEHSQVNICAKNHNNTNLRGNTYIYIGCMHVKKTVKINSG